MGNDMKSEKLSGRKAPVAAALTAALLIGLPGCTAPAGNSNATLNANAGAANANAGAVNANASASATAADALPTREPETYSATTSINVQTSGQAERVNVPPLQFEVARAGANRRWTFNLPAPVGQVIYLDRAGVQYLVLPDRRQYVELTPETLGFNLPRLMTPAAAVEQLKARTQYEVLGTETVNGRAATKYRFRGAADTRTQAGTVQADSVVYVDEATGLPLRAEIDSSTTSGAGARIITETRNIQTTVDPTTFDLPAGYRKVSREELQQQVQNFVAALRVFTALLQQQSATTPPPAGNTNGNVNANGNANR